MVVKTNSRYAGIDILKAVCAFFVVCIHCPFPGKIGEYFTVLTRIAVPTFFMITGFFYSDTVAKGRIGAQIKKIAVLGVSANLIYLLFNTMLKIIRGGDYLAEFLNGKSLLAFLVFNESPFGGHLWYLGAILYVLAIVAISDKFNLRKLLYALTPLLLASDLLLGKYSLVVFSQEFPVIYARNFLFVGLPYFCIGCLLRKHEKTVGDFGIPKTALLIVAFAALTLSERYILVLTRLASAREHYISTTFLAVAVFFIAVQISTVRLPKCADILMTVGRDYTTWIYILHPIFITVLMYVVNKLDFSTLFSFIAPIVVYAATSLFVAIVLHIYKTMHERRAAKAFEKSHRRE